MADGESTHSRDHNDLDIALPHAQVYQLRLLLVKKGYKEIPSNDTSKHNFVLADERNYQIDVHSYIFDKKGNNIGGVLYKPEHLIGQGVIAGQSVQCIPPGIMVKFHTGYVLDENNYHDVKLLCHKFGLPLPEVYKSFEPLP